MDYALHFSQLDPTNLTPKLTTAWKVSREVACLISCKHNHMLTHMHTHTVDCCIRHFVFLSLILFLDSLFYCIVEEITLHYTLMESDSLHQSRNKQVEDHFLICNFFFLEGIAAGSLVKVEPGLCGQSTES